MNLSTEFYFRVLTHVPWLNLNAWMNTLLFDSREFYKFYSYWNFWIKFYSLECEGSPMRCLMTLEIEYNLNYILLRFIWKLFCIKMKEILLRRCILRKNLVMDRDLDGYIIFSSLVTNVLLDRRVLSLFI